MFCWLGAAIGVTSLVIAPIVAKQAAENAVGEELVPAIERLHEAVKDLAGAPIVQQTNTVQMPPSDAELRDQRLRDIHRSQGTIAQE